MAMFFSPSITALIGHRAWWPGHGDQAAAAAPQAQAAGGRHEVTAAR
jgi:RND superfamily putative drug exporter